MKIIAIGTLIIVLITDIAAIAAAGRADRAEEIAWLGNLEKEDDHAGRGSNDDHTERAEKHTT